MIGTTTGDDEEGNTDLIRGRKCCIACKATSFSFVFLYLCVFKCNSVNSFANLSRLFLL